MAMKKRISKLALLLCSLALTSCNVQFTFHSLNSASENTLTTTSSDSNLDTSNSTSINYVETKQLAITSLPVMTSFYLYDILDLSGLVVEEQIYHDNVLYSSTPITDYTLNYSDDNSLVIPGQRLTNFREVATVNVSKEGFIGNSFSFFMDNISSFHQTLRFLTKTETTFSYPATLTLDSLSVELYTTYKRDKAKTFTEVLNSNDYTVTIKKDGVSYDANNFVFPSIGRYELHVTYKGWVDVLESSYTIAVLDANDYSELINLPTYDDNTITFETDTTGMKVTFTNNSKDLDANDKGYYEPSEVINAFNIEDYATYNAGLIKHTPTKGEVPLLVVPVITPGDENKATDSNKELIKKAFFGNSSDLHFESLHSYYYQSSFGQLNFKGGVTDYFDPSTVDSNFKKINYYNETTISKLPELAFQWVKDNYNIDPQKYDSNNDGYIDGIWLIYLHHSSANSSFWAYQTSTQKIYTSGEPIINVYGWASLDFLNDQFRSIYNYHSYENHECDAHVLIHETGHMLGLSDYYSYAENSNYAPLGCIDFMDHNVLDHNPYSKMLFNWVTPYLVYGNCTITIPSCQTKDALFVIPYDDKNYKKDANGKVLFNVFDEYLVLDYYTYKNLNVQGYDCYGVSTPSSNGGRLYHVDARLCKYSGMFTLFSDPDDVMSNSDYIFRVISNSESGDRAEINLSQDMTSTLKNEWDEIRWISADKSYLSANTLASNSSLFKKGNTFSIASYANQFNKTTKEVEEDTLTYYTNIQKDFSTSFKIDDFLTI